MGAARERAREGAEYPAVRPESFSLSPGAAAPVGHDTMAEVFADFAQHSLRRQAAEPYIVASVGAQEEQHSGNVDPLATMDDVAAMTNVAAVSRNNSTLLSAVATASWVTYQSCRALSGVAAMTG